MPNPSTYFAGYLESLAAKACIVDISLPTFAGIASVTFQTDGSAVVTWASATSTKTPVRYEIYVSPGSVSAGALFVTANRVAFAPGALTAWRIFVLRDQVTYFMPGVVYTFGIRAVDSQNFTDTNTAILTATALYPNYGTLAAVVWDQLTAAHTVAGSFGEMVEEINSDVDEIITTLGTPAGASMSADIAEIEAETDGIAAIPTNPLLTNDSRLNHIDADISSRVATTHFDSVIGTPVGASVSADIAEIEAETDGIAAIPTNPLLSTDIRLNHLDVDISTREPSTDPRLAHLDADISSRLSAASYTAPDNADIAAIKAKTDNLPADPASNTEVDTRLASADARLNHLDADISSRSTLTANNVWSEDLTPYNTANTAGKDLKDAAAGSGGSSTKVVGIELDLEMHQNSIDMDVGANELDVDIGSFEMEIAIEC